MHTTGVLRKERYPKEVLQRIAADLRQGAFSKKIPKGISLRSADNPENPPTVKESLENRTTQEKSPEPLNKKTAQPDIPNTDCPQYRASRRAELSFAHKPLRWPTTT